MALNIKRARKVVQFYPDETHAAEIEAASDALVEAKKNVATDGRLASKSQTAVKAAEKAFEAAKANAASSVLDVELEALSVKRWNEIKQNHPPREGDESDGVTGLNWSTFLGEALSESVVSVKDSTGSVVEVSVEEWEAAAEEIRDGQYTTLAMALLGLNQSSHRPF